MSSTGHPSTACTVSGGGTPPTEPKEIRSFARRPPSPPPTPSSSLPAPTTTRWGGQSPAPPISAREALARGGDDWAWSVGVWGLAPPRPTRAAAPAAPGVNGGTRLRCSHPPSKASPLAAAPPPRCRPPSPSLSPSPLSPPLPCVALLPPGFLLGPRTAVAVGPARQAGGRDRVLDGRRVDFTARRGGAGAGGLETRRYRLLAVRRPAVSSDAHCQPRAAAGAPHSPRARAPVPSSVVGDDAPPPPSPLRVCGCPTDAPPTAPAHLRHAPRLGRAAPDPQRHTGRPRWPPALPLP